MNEKQEMGQRSLAKLMFDESHLEKSPMNWHVWKQAFGLGYSARAKEIEDLKKGGEILVEYLNEDMVEPTEELEGILKAFDVVFINEEKGWEKITTNKKPYQCKEHNWVGTKGNMFCNKCNTRY